jgi:hypothetical protein
MAFANIAAGEDDLRDIAMSLREDPTAGDLEEDLKRWRRENGREML